MDGRASRLRPCLRMREAHYAWSELSYPFLPFRRASIGSRICYALEANYRTVLVALKRSSSPPRLRLNARVRQPVLPTLRYPFGRRRLRLYLALAFHREQQTPLTTVPGRFPLRLGGGC